MQQAKKWRFIWNFSGKHPEARGSFEELDFEKKFYQNCRIFSQNRWEAVDLIPLAQHQDRWRAFGSGTVEGFLTCRESFSFSQRILRDGTSA
jgi:hypothetical protein